MIKLFGLTLFVGLSMSVATVVSGVVFLATGGIALCQVETPDVDLMIPVPTHLVDASLLVARFAVPDRELAEIRRQAEPWIPMVETAAAALADVPDGTVLVSVATADETVLVERRRGRLRVDVDSADADVQVSMPARSFERIARQVSRLL